MKTTNLSTEKIFMFDEIHEHPNIYEKTKKDLNTMINTEPTEPMSPIIHNYFAKYYEANKEKLRQKAKAKVSCPLCDRIVSKASLNSHLKTNLCSKYQELKIKKIIIGKLISTDADNHYNEKTK